MKLTEKIIGEHQELAWDDIPIVEACRHVGHSTRDFYRWAEQGEAGEDELAARFYEHVVLYRRADRDGLASGLGVFDLRSGLTPFECVGGKIRPKKLSEADWRQAWTLYRDEVRSHDALYGWPPGAWWYLQAEDPPEHPEGRRECGDGPYHMLTPREDREAWRSAEEEWQAQLRQYLGTESTSP